jgi:hypothetical protein
MSILLWNNHENAGGDGFNTQVPSTNEGSTSQEGALFLRRASLIWQMHHQPKNNTSIKRR